ncbi:MAG: FtsW/RodA/SpoVE family cell cycle protein [Rikenellaceae bacterium]
MRQQKSIEWFSGDRVLWIIIATLAIISVLVVYSSTAKMAYDTSASSSTSHYLFTQLTYLLVSLVGIFFTHKIDARYFYKWAPVAMIVALFLTVLAYALGYSTNGAARWLPIGGFNLQPSEMLKVTTLLVLARSLAVRQKVIETLKITPSFNPLKWLTPAQKKIWREGTFPILMPVAVGCGVIITAHTSSAILLGAVSFIVMMIGRVKWSELGRIMLWVALFGALYYCLDMGRSETASGRVGTWYEIWTTDRTQVDIHNLADTDRSMIAIHNGALLGEGAGQSAMRVELIHPESDYAFALFVEEYGIILALVLMMLYLWLFFRAIEICRECRTAFPALMTLGVSAMITSQALLHIMVSINLIPETGQTLPLISRGGSSLLFTAIALGMVLSVSRQNQKEKR